MCFEASMKDITDLLKSRRFWQLFLIGVTTGLNFPFPNSPWLQGLAAAIAIWFGGSVVARTVDKINEEPASKE